MATVEEKDDVPLIIRFILPKGKTETTCSEDLGYAFDQAQDHGLEPTWIDEQDCLSINPGKTVRIYHVSKATAIKVDKITIDKKNFYVDFLIIIRFLISGCVCYRSFRRRWISTSF